MAKPYSYDLRQKVIQAITLDGLNKTEASQLFNISRNTIGLWLKRLDLTGDFQPKPNQPPGNGHKITDWKNSANLPKLMGIKLSFVMVSLWFGEISDCAARSA